MKLQTILSLWIAAPLFACNSETLPDEPAAPQLVPDADYAKLIGTEWINHDQSREKSYTASRLRFEQDDSGIYVLFSGSRLDRVGHGAWPRNWAADMMRYDCTFEGSEDSRRLGCLEQDREWEWCMPAVIQGQECTLEMLQVMDPEITNKERRSAERKAKKEFERFNERYNQGSGMNSGELTQYVQMWTKLYQTDQSKLGISAYDSGDIKVVDTHVDFKVEADGDDGEKLVAKADLATPNDRSGWSFIAYDKGDLLWEHCDLSRRYISVSDTAGFPENPFKEGLPGQDRMAYPFGTELTFTHVQLSEDVLGAYDEPLDDSCSFEFDAYHRGVRVVEGQKGEVHTKYDAGWKKDRTYAVLQWSYTPDRPSDDPDYFPDLVHMVITRHCGDKVEKFVSCQDLDITAP